MRAYTRLICHKAASVLRSINEVNFSLFKFNVIHHDHSPFASLQTGNDLQEDPTARGSQPLNLI